MPIYSHSPINALKAIYPEYNWEPFELRTVPNGFWSDPSNQRRYLEYLAK